jgi:hypothetical protein
LVVVPSWAVTTVVIVLCPTGTDTVFNVPEGTATPFTVIVALADVVVAVTSTEALAIGTRSV